MKALFFLTGLLAVFAGLSHLLADVKSISGQDINFDLNNDTTKEMILSANGLGVGIVPSNNLHVDGQAIVTGNVYLGTTSSNAALHIEGSLGFERETVTSDTTLSNNTMILANTTSNNITLTLPAAAGAAGRIYNIKKISNNNTLSIVGEDNVIDVYTQLDLTTATNGIPFVEFVSDNYMWRLINENEIAASSNQATIMHHRKGGSSTSTSTTVNKNFESKVDLNKSFLIFSHRYSSGDAAGGQIRGQLTNLSEARFDKIGSVSHTVEYYAAYFSHGVDVQTFTTTNNVTTALGTAVDPTNTFLIHSWKHVGSSTQWGTDDTCGAYINSSGVSVVTDNNSGSPNSAVFVVSLDSATVQSGNASLAAGSGTVDVALGTAVSTGRAFHIFSMKTNNDVNADDFGVSSELTSNNIHFYRQQTAATLTLFWFVVEFHDNTKVQGGVTEVGSTNTISDIAVSPYKVYRSIPFIPGVHNSAGSTSDTADSGRYVMYTITDNGDQQLQVQRAESASAGNVSWHLLDFSENEVRD